MVRESSVKMGRKEKEVVILMSSEIDDLRKQLWKTIHEFSGKISKTDVSMSLGLVQYELIRHDEKDI